jgi:molybdopterin-guanine dinucleotide biosynthesis protein A
MTTFAGIVLAGGSARRMGGRDKLMVTVAGRPMLHTALAAVGDAKPRIVVGPSELRPELPAGTLLTRENPPGGGPVAAIGAGLALVPNDVTVVAVVAADQPFLTTAAIQRLAEALRGSAAAGAVYVDADGRQQRGLTFWRAGPLRQFLAAIPDLDGIAIGRLTGGSPVIEVGTPDRSGPPPWYDCDTEEDLRRAEEWAHADTG